MDHTQQTRAVSGLIKRAESILFITGAGISAQSGLPTYRGIGGLYDNQATEEGLTIEEALSGMTFQRLPALTWKYLRQIEENCRHAKPNRAHLLLAELERQKPDTWILTQNVDGLHQQAGSHNIIDIHGSLHHLFCPHCNYVTDITDYSTLASLPSCPQCRQVIRPDIILFGEQLPQPKLDTLTRVMTEGVDLIVSIGTSSAFPYISGAIVWGKQHHIPTVEINPEATQISHIVEYRLPMRAVEALEALLAP